MSVPRSVAFFVPGVPQPGGSKKGFAIQNKATGKWRAIVVEDAKHNASWRAVVSLAAQEAGFDPFLGPVVLTLEFRMPRPKGHYGTGRRAHVLKESAPLAHTSKPDRTKLMRSTEDALTGIAWKDDTQVVDGRTTKLYTNDGRPGCMITITEFLGDRVARAVVVSVPVEQVGLPL
jgi:Holliday junction resolvase RusA-like endonuclease